MTTTPHTPRASPATLRGPSGSCSHSAAKSAPNRGERELNTASMDAGRYRAAAE